MSEATKEQSPTGRVGRVGVRGRYPGRPGALHAGNIHVHVTDYSDAVVIRLEDERHPDFWLELTLRPNEEDRDDVCRMISEGCPNCGEES